MEIEGKVIRALGERSGRADDGRSWRIREYLLQPFGRSDRPVAFGFFGSLADEYPLDEGDEIALSFDIVSRQYGSRWYTDLRAYSASRLSGAPLGVPEPDELSVAEAAARYE